MIERHQQITGDRDLAITPTDMIPSKEGYVFLKYNLRGRYKIESSIKDYISKLILSTTKTWIKEKSKKKPNTLAVASYSIVDIEDEEISRRCNWIEVRKGLSADAIVLDYYGEHNWRYFCHGSKKGITHFVKEYPNIEYSLVEHPGDFRVVLPAWQFSRAELTNLPGENWELKDGSAELVTRMVLDIKDFKQKDLQLPDGLEIVDVNDDLVPAVLEMLEEANTHHSFKSRDYDKHKAIVEKSTGRVVALSGILAKVSPANSPSIVLTGNMAVREEYRRKGLATAVRHATLQQIKEMEGFNQGIVVADANDLSYGVNLKLGYHPIAVDGTIAQFWWCIYNKTG